MSLRCFLCACCCYNSNASVSPSCILLPYCTSSSFILSRRQGWNTRQSIIILSMILVMFALSTAHWIADLTLLLRRIDSSPLIVDSSVDTVFSAFAKVNVSKPENKHVTPVLMMSCLVRYCWCCSRLENLDTLQIWILKAASHRLSCRLGNYVQSVSFWLRVLYAWLDGYSTHSVDNNPEGFYQCHYWFRHWSRPCCSWA